MESEKSLVEVLGFAKGTDLTTENVREVIGHIETFARAGDMGPPVEIPITHHFSKDIYGREMRMKAGDLVVGKIHRFSQLNILSSGEVSILSIDGLLQVKAPYTFVGSEGAKRLIYAHSDVTWTTIHGTDLKDVDQIEEQFIVKDYSQLKLEGS